MVGHKKIALVWFNTNLRLNDNECLHQAILENDEVIPFYCFDPSLLQYTSFGFRKAGDFRLQFLKESLEQLDQALRLYGSGLVLLYGNPEQEILKLAGDLGASRIYTEREVAPEELSLQKNVAHALISVNCQLLTFECRNLLHSLDLPFSMEDLPAIFTAFRTKIEKAFVVRPLLPKPENIPSPRIAALNQGQLDQITSSNVRVDSRSAMHFKGGLHAAHERLNYYFHETHGISTYKETRNGMVGERYSSKFSAWLALGCISAKENYTAIKMYEEAHGANASTYWLVFELLWRDYFGFCMEKDSARYFKKSDQESVEAGSERFDAALNSWINGITGVPFIDANMIELKLTGFMSNRGRQNVASYLCNDLRIDWRYGAAYFEQQLIDYDVCNNWCNWAYIAGVGNDPRNNRYFNISKQSLTYDPDGTFQKLWLKS
ncbi:MAG: DASH family cryptochrome [Pedobacter sp.]|nr:MAG: DASH family cryptochrome [Pedobacter sp.]